MIDRSALAMNDIAPRTSRGSDTSKTLNGVTRGKESR